MIPRFCDRFVEDLAVFLYGESVLLGYCSNGNLWKVRKDGRLLAEGNMCKLIAVVIDMAKGLLDEDGAQVASYAGRLAEA